MKRASRAFFLICPTLFSSALFAGDFLISSPSRALSSCSDFPSVDEIGEIFDDMEAEYPQIARHLEIGTSVEGRALHAIRLSVDPDEDAVEPEVRLTGGIHGNECMGVEILMLAAEWLVSAFGEDEFVTKLLENSETVIIPLVNPDGYSGEPASRGNANGVDLNRNLHFAWTGGGASPFSEPETRALRDFSLDNAFNLGISYHTVSYYVNASWNYTPHHPPDEALFEAIGEGYAGTSAYQVVFGWDWYNIQGDVNDWSLGTSGAFDWTVELMSDTDSQWGINREGLEGFLSFVFQGAQGLVTDADTNEPLLARITVSPEGAPIFTDEDIGDYNRLLLPGTYDITAHAPGYVSQTVEGAVVEEGKMTRVDFALDRDEDALAYAFKVDGMTLPQSIPTPEYDESNPYLNESMVWEALGAPDGRAYSLSSDPDVGASENPPVDLSDPIGSITLDMGESAWVTNGAGADFRVVSASKSDEPAAVLVAQDRDGPFVLVTKSSGTIDADLDGTGFDAIRFVRVVDLGDGPFNDSSSGYDLDAVVNLSVNNDKDDNSDADTETDGHDDGSSDAGQSDGGSEIVGAVSGDCGCAAVGQASDFNAIKWIKLFFGDRSDSFKVHEFQM